MAHDPLQHLDIVSIPYNGELKGEDVFMFSCYRQYSTWYSIVQHTGAINTTINTACVDYYY